MKPTPALVPTLVALVLATAPATPADPDPAAQACFDAIEDATAAFRAFPDGVPAPVAQAGVQELHAACYRPDPDAVAQILPVEPEPARTGPPPDPVLVEDLEVACSGGGSTVIGWANHLEILGESFHVLNSPASSYTTYYKHPDQEGVEEGFVRVLVEGNARSTLDDLDIALVDTEKGPAEHGHWFFARLPMGGSYSIEPRCLLAVVTSTTFTVSGSPLGVDVINVGVPVLKVRSTGTTCVIPC